MMSVTITNLTTGQQLAEHADIAHSPWQRVVGLLNRNALREGDALIFPRCDSIHTWFMRFPIDVVFVRRNQVVKVVASVRPCRITWAIGADTTIELPAGMAERTLTHVGATLRIVS